DGIKALAFSPREDLLVTAGEDDTIRFWDAKTGAGQVARDPGQGPFHALAFTPDGQTLFVGAIDGQVHVWDVARRQRRRLLHSVGGRPIISLAVSPDGQFLAAGSMQGIFTLFDWKSGEVRQRFLMHQDRIASLAFSPDGKKLASAGGDF